jgi:hypothetical protein
MAVESMAEHNFMVGPEAQRLEDDVETIQYIILQASNGWGCMLTEDYRP